MNPIQIVLDASLLYAGLRFRQGASFNLLKHLETGRFALNLSVPLILEYEEVLLRKEPTLNFTPEEIGIFLDYLCRIANFAALPICMRCTFCGGPT